MNIKFLRMKKTIFAFILLISIPVLQNNAQGRQERSPESHEKFRSMKVAYFTEELGLTSEEAEKFWPVYNEYDNKRSELSRERRKVFREFSAEMETRSDEQAVEMVDRHIEFQKKGLKLEIDFYAKIKEILPPKKIIKIYITEVHFREHMLMQLRGEKYRQGNRNPEKHP